MTGLGGVFGHRGVAVAYQHRPPYPQEVYDLLERLVVDEPRHVLDLGAGEGALARELATRVDRVDAVDISAAMIEAGRDRPGGRHPNLNWVLGAAETVELDGPYALVTAGASLHWMDWDTTFARIASVLTANGQVAIIEHGERGQPWREAEYEVIRRHSRKPDFDTSFSLVEALRERGLYAVTGRAEIGPVPFAQPVDDYVEQFHSRASLAREHMDAAEIEDFSTAMRSAVAPFARDGMLKLPVVAEITWGRPT